MNLGQAIDPEWVQSGMHRRLPAHQKQAPAVASVLPTPSVGRPFKTGSNAQKILAILARCGPCGIARMRAEWGGDYPGPAYVSAVISGVRKHGDLEVLAVQGPRQYAITAQGRARLA